MKFLRNKCKPQVATGAVEIKDRVTIRSAALHLKRVGCNIRSAPVTTVRVGVVEGYPKSKYTLNNHSSLFASMYTKQFFKERDSCAGFCVQLKRVFGSQCSVLPNQNNVCLDSHQVLDDNNYSSWAACKNIHCDNTKQQHLGTIT